MRGPGQIAELTALAAPDVGVIVNVGPCIWSCWERSRRSRPPSGADRGISSGATIVLPAGEPLLDPHVRADVRTVTFGAAARWSSPSRRGREERS